MELRREDPPGLHRRGEAHAILTPRLAQVTGRGHGVIGVHEVKVRAVGDALEETQLPAVPHAIPPHVRHIETGREATHHARDRVEALAMAELLAAREQNLVADADAEERTATVERAADRIEEA